MASFCRWKDFESLVQYLSNAPLRQSDIKGAYPGSKRLYHRPEGKTRVEGTFVSWGLIFTSERVNSNI